MDTIPLTDEELLTICKEYRPDIVNLSEARAVAQAQCEKSARITKEIFEVKDSANNS